MDSTGNIYIADTGNHRIRKVTIASGIIDTIAGTGLPGYSGDSGQATAAQVNYPLGVALDSAGNLYIGDYSNHRVRKVDADTGNIETIAGTGHGGLQRRRTGGNFGATQPAPRRSRGLCG